MAHPYASHRDHKVSDRRVGELTRGYASGGGVSRAEHADVTRAVHAHEKHMHGGEKETRLATGGPARHRPDHRAKGGRVKSKGTTVNVVVAPQGQQGATPVPVPVPAAGAAPPPPKPPMPPAPGMAPAAGMMPPGAPPPGMPMRKAGGRVGTEVWDEGRRNGTQISHRTKNDLDKINTKPPLLTRARGGPVEASNAVGPKMRFGADSGEGRLERTALQRRSKLP